MIVIWLSRGGNRGDQAGLGCVMAGEFGADPRRGSAQGSAPKRDASEVGEVIVTAQRREQRLLGDCLRMLRSRVFALNSGGRFALNVFK